MDLIDKCFFSWIRKDLIDPLEENSTFIPDKPSLNIREPSIDEKANFQRQLELIKSATEDNKSNNLDNETLTVMDTLTLLHRLVGFWNLFILASIFGMLSLNKSACLFVMRKTFELFETLKNEKSTELGDVNSPRSLIYWAILYMGIHLCLKILQSIVQNHFNLKRYSDRKMAMSYLKELLLRKLSKIQYIHMQTKFNFGIVTTLLSSDLWTVCVNTYDLSKFYSHIIFLTISFISMYSLVGWKATFSGLIFLAVTSPAYMYFIRERRLKVRESKKLTEKKASMLSQFIQTIRLIKIYTLESLFLGRFDQIQHEFRQNRKEYGLLTFVRDSIYYLQSFGVSFLCFFVYCYIDGNTLKLSTALTIVELCNSIKWPLFSIFSDLQSIYSKRTSIMRIGCLLNTQDHCNHPESLTEGYDLVIKLEDVSANWSHEDDQQPIIEGINLTISKGEHVALVGKVGSGKTTLIHTILNESHILKGIAATKNNFSVSYVSQNPWIRNGTIRENVLFGSETFNEERYEKALKASDIQSDISGMRDGDLQIIGEKGINLSGGQKTRLALARALYHDSDLYIFDDIFSAVDVYTAKNIMDRVFFDSDAILREKSVLLTTHHLDLLPHMDKVLVMDKGKVIFTENYENLINLMTKTPSSSILHEIIQHNGEISQFKVSKEPKVPDSSTVQVKKSVKPNVERKKGQNPTFGLIYQFLLSLGTTSVVYLFLMMILTISEPITGIYKDLTLSEWSLDQFFSQHSLSFYMIVYSTQGLFQMVCGALNQLLVERYMYSLADLFQTKFLSRLAKAKLVYYEDIPSGRMLDTVNLIQEVRETVGGTISDFLSNTCSAVFCTVLVLYSFPQVLTLLFVSIPLTNYYRSIYSKVSDDIHHLQKYKNDPTPTISSEILHGLDTVRSYGPQKVDHLIKDINTQRKAFTSPSYCRELVWAWFSVRNDIFREIIFGLAVGGIFIYHFWNSTPNNDVKIFQITISLFYRRISELVLSMERVLYTITKTKNSFSCVEKVQDFSNQIEEEKYGKDSPNILNQDEEGMSIIFDNVSMRYREENDQVLCGVSFSIRPGSKCAIIGRTASGKTSLLNALLRFQEIDSKNDAGIYLNGVDIKELSLTSLRQNISFIPQSPVLFLGNLRDNLDFQSTYSDEEIWAALEHVGLIELLTRRVLNKDSRVGEVSNSQLKTLVLDYKIAENGTNFSCGEKQLICLARAILKQSKLLLMDEATSNIDNYTDSKIQQTLRSNLFDKCTIITIAHRIETVKDYDRIILMKTGRVEKNGPPEIVLDHFFKHYDN